MLAYIYSHSIYCKNNSTSCMRALRLNSRPFVRWWQCMQTIYVWSTCVQRWTLWAGVGARRKRRRRRIVGVDAPGGFPPQVAEVHQAARCAVRRPTVGGRDGGVARGHRCQRRWGTCLQRRRRWQSSTDKWWWSGCSAGGERDVVDDGDGQERKGRSDDDNGRDDDGQQGTYVRTCIYMEIPSYYSLSLPTIYLLG